MEIPALRTGIVAAAMLCGTAPLSAQDVWEPLDAGTTQDLHAVHFVSAEVGYVAGAAGIVLKTTDGGATWEDVSPGGGQDLYGVYFFDDDAGVVVGSGGAIGRTEDGGTTWSPVPSGTSETLYSVAFADDVGLAGGGSQAILRSEDRGATWAVVQDGFFGGGFFGADMVDDAVGFVAGANSIFQPLFGGTADGGATFDFTAFYLNSNEGRLEDVHFHDASEGIAVGRTWDFQGAISRSADSGQAWVTTLVGEALEAVDFATAETGYAVGAMGIMLKTNDGGQTWAPEQSGTAETLRGLSIPTPSRGYAVGSAGTVLRGTITSSTAALDDPASLRFALAPNHPNPFHGRTVIRYSLPRGAHVTLRVYDALGREVVRLVDGYRAPGHHEVPFDAGSLSAGGYLGVLEAGPFTSSRRMLHVE